MPDDGTDPHGSRRHAALSERLSHWLRARLERELLVWLVAIVLVVSIAFLVAAFWLGDRALRAEHQAAAGRVAQLFEASLRNAMLKRDLPGMQLVLAELGRMPQVRQALVLAPSGEARFSAAADGPLGHRPELLAGLCLHGACASTPPVHHWFESPDGPRMRIVHPIRNAAACSGCHGDPRAHPVNGILVVDFDAPVLEREARAQSLPLALSGAAVIATLAMAVWWVLRRRVVTPVRRLSDTVRAQAAGDLGARAAMRGTNEFTDLGNQLDHLAESTHRLIERVDGQRAYLQRLIDADPDPLLVIGEDYRIVNANHGYAELVGVPNPVGRFCYEVSRGRGEPCPATLVTCPVVELRGEAGPLRCAMQFRRADGTPIEVEIEAAPLEVEAGQRRIVESIRRLDDKLKFSQEQRLSAIGLLANGVAHEIHNPLASIRIALQASLRGMRKGTMAAGELISYLELVDREIDRCVSITQRLMSMSQPVGEPATALAVDAVVRETVSLLGEEAGRLCVTISVEIEPAGVCVRAADGELRMVVLNLVQNALHAMPDGGRLAIRGRVRDRQCVLEFEDDGCGIAPENLASVFLPFFSRRADGTRGTGLGLAISRASVERWGGHLSVRSELGAGSVFEVRLPLWEAGA